MMIIEVILFCLLLKKKYSKKEKNSKEKFCNYNTYGKQKYTTQTLPLRSKYIYYHFSLFLLLDCQ